MKIIQGILVSAMLFMPLPASYAYNPIEKNMNDYLKRVVHNYRLILTDPSLDMENISFLTRWVDSSELRLATDNAKNRKRSVALNIKLNKHASMDTQQKILVLQSDIEQFDHKKIFNRYLKSVYIQLIDLNEKMALKRHLQKQLRVTSAQTKYLQGLVQSSDFNPEDLLEVELDQEQKKLQRAGLHDVIQLLTNSMKLFVNQAFISLKTEEMIKRIKYFTSQDSVDFKQAGMNERLSKLKLILQQEKEGFALNGVQITSEFDQNKEKVFGIRVDIQLPFTGSYYKHKLLQQDIYQAMQRKDQFKQQDIFTSSTLLQKIQIYNSELLAVKKIKWRITRRFKTVTDTRLVLKLKMQSLRQEKKIIDIHHKIMGNYIEFLSTQGALAEYAHVNWLSSDAIPIFKEP